MPLASFDSILERAQSVKQKHRLAVVSAHENHTLQAVKQATLEQVIEPILIGDKAAIRQIMQEIDFVQPGIQIIDCPDKEAAAHTAVEMVRWRQADYLMKGLLDTSVLLKAVLHKETGLFAGGILSHMSLVHIPAFSRLLAITDAAMIISPTVEEKKHIIQNTVHALSSLGIDNPHVAVLSSIETINPKMQDTVDAGALKELWAAGEITNCILEGPISMDLALNHEAAEIKGYNSPVAGKADILIMPNMVTGNILSKALREFAQSTVVGVVLGAQVPICLTSRGASVTTKYNTIVVVSEMLASS